MALKCELCNSVEFMKEDGFFVCQGCNTKYSVEEAKKLMSVTSEENTLKSEGAKDKKLENLRILAERAREENDSITASKYYEQILIEDPNDWEANFYPIFYDCHNIKIAQIGDAATRVNNIIPSVFKIIDKTLSGEEKNTAYTRITTEVTSFYSMLLNNITPNLGSDPTYAKQNIKKWVIPTVRMLVTLGDCIMQTENMLLIKIAASQTFELAHNAADSSSWAASYEFSQIKSDTAKRMSEVKALISAKEKEEKQQRIDAYWAEHDQEKEALVNERTDLEKRIEEIKKQIYESEKADAPRLAELEKEKSKTIPEEIAAQEQMNKIKELQKQKAQLGLFKFKEKKEIDLQIDTVENPLYEELKKKAEESKTEHKNKICAEIQEIKSKTLDIKAMLTQLIERTSEIKFELEKDR